MDSDFIIAIVTSIATAGSTAGVAITALVLTNNRAARIETKLDKIDTSLEMLNGSLHEIDKRVGLIEDRMFGRGVS